MLEKYSSAPLSVFVSAFLTTKNALATAAWIALLSATGCTAAMQRDADQSYLQLKKSLVETLQGKEVKRITIPADALVAKPASLNQLLRKIGRLAVKDNRAVEITSVDNDRNYLRQGVARGARESGKDVKITMLDTRSRANTLIVLK
ncbi:MAG: hypothetical protein ABIQ54_03195 [Gammaproteobacteria bacterium]